MVAIITGKGAGIENGSATVLGQKGVAGNASTGRSGESIYVNGTTGNLVLTTLDEMLVGLGPDATISRTYNSIGYNGQNVWDGENGDNWRASPYRRLTLSAGWTWGGASSTITRTDWDGSEATYTWVSNYLGGSAGAYVNKDGDGAYDVIVQGGTNELKWIDGATQAHELYDTANNGRITKRGDLNGNLLTFAYDGSNRLTTITTTTSDGTVENTTLTYTGTDIQSLVTTTKTGGITRVFYEYDAYHRLTGVKVNLTPADNSATVTAGTPSTFNYSTTYTYKSATSSDAGFKLIDTITQDDGTFVKFTYDGSSRVTQIEEGISGASATPSVSRITQFAYSVDGSGNKVLTVTDALSQVTTLVSDANGNLKSVTMPPSGTSDPAPVVAFDYDSDGDVTSVSSAGNTITYEYDLRGNRTRERDSLGNTTERTFNIAYDALTGREKNELTSEVRYTVADVDGAESGLPSGAVTTRFAYDGKSNLRFVIDAEGMVTEHQYNSAGQRLATLSYSTAKTAGPFDLPSMQTWAATATALERTETLYDFRGNISEVISYSKLIASGTDKNKFDLTSERSRTVYIYSAYGDLLARQVEGAPTSETYVYDGLGRLTIAREGSSTNLFTGANTATFWTTAGASDADVASTPAGPAISLTAQSSGTALAIAGSSGSPISVVDGDVLTFTVQLLAGSATSTTASFGILSSISLFGPNADSVGVKVSGPGAISTVSGGAFQVTGLSQTQVTTVTVTRTFTQAESAYARVYVGSASAGAPNGNSIIFANASMSRAKNTQSITYTEATAGSTTSVKLANGLTQLSQFDRAGNLIALVESGAGVTSTTTNYIYDKLGQLRVVVEPTTSGSPSLTDPARRRNYMFYDADGRKIADVDADGSAIEYRYDAAGRVTATIAYANAVAVAALTPGNSNPSILDTSGNLRAVTFASIRPAASTTDDRWSWTVYDIAGRVARTIDGTGAVTSYFYDGASQLTSTTQHSVRLSDNEIAYLKTNPTGAPNLLANSQLVTPSGWKKNVDASNIVAVGSPLVGTTSGKAYLKANFAATAAGQVASLSTDDSSWVSVTAGQRLAVQAGIESVGAVSQVQLVVHWRNASGTSLGSSTVGTLSGAQAFDTKISGFVTPPAGAASARIEVIMTSSAAGAGSFSIVRPMLTVASAAQTTYPVFSPTVATDSANDRITRNFYDNSGRLIGTLDAEGFISKIEYDKAGRKVHTIARKNAPTATTGNFATIFALATPVEAEDIHNWWIYDARGLVRATVDAEGTVTRFDYTASGYVSQQTFGQKIPTATLATWMVTPPTLASLPAAGGGEVLSVTSWTYNSWGQPLTEVVTLTGSVTTTTTYVYDAMRNLASTTTQTGGADQRSYNKRYDGFGRLIGELSAAGSAALAAISNPTASDITNIYKQYGVNYAYDASDRLISKTDASGTFGVDGSKTLYYYNTDGALAYEIDALGGVTEYRYNAFDEQNRVIRYSVRVSTTGLNGGEASALPSAVTTALTNDAFETDVRTAYFRNGMAASVTDALNNITSYTYSAFGELATSIAPLDNNGPSGAARTIQTTRIYDRRGSLETETVDSAAGGKMLLTTYEYDAFGRAVKVWDFNNQKTESTYDREGRLKSVKDATNSTTTYEYDPRGNLVKVTDQLLQVTRYVYDKANRRVATIDALGSVTLNTYDADGRLTVTRDYYNRIAAFPGTTIEVTEAALATALATAGGETANDHVTRYAYDVDGRLKYTVDALRHVVEYRYDISGNIIRTIAWDGAIAAAGAGGYTTSYITGALGSLVAANARVTRTVYDALNQAAFTIDALGQVTGQTFDAKGQLIKQVLYGTVYTGSDDPTYTYMSSSSGTNWLAASNQTNAADDRTSRAYYDAAGNQLYSINAVGQVTGYTYNKDGSLTRQVRYGALFAATDATTVANLNALATGTGRITTFSYDSAGRLIDTVDPEGFHTQLTLDAMGRVTQSTTGVYLDANGNVDATKTSASTTAFEYDAVGRVTRQTFGVGTAQATATKLKYDALGRLTDKFVGLATTEAVSNDTLAGGTQATITHWTYDELGRVKTETRGYTAGDPAELQYSYDSLGRVLTVTDARSTVTRNVYDALDQLASQTVEMVSEANIATSYIYDSFGSVIKTTDPRLNPSYAYYDKLGRLTRQVDGEKYVTDTSYTRGGAIESVTRWANALTVAISEAARPDDPVADANRDAATLFTYNKNNELLGTTDAEGHSESYTLNVYGERWTFTNKLGSTTTYTYDRRGLVTLSSQVISQRDSNGNIISGTSKTINETYEYDARGNRTKMVEAAYVAEQRTTRYEYDALDRVTRTYNGTAVTLTNATTLGTTTSDLSEYFAYDRRGNLIDKTDAANQHSYSWYDDHDRKTHELSVGRTLSQWSYDANGNVDSVKVYGTLLNPTGTSTPPSVAGVGFRQTFFDYDRANRQTAVRIQGVTTGAIDANGNYVVTEGTLSGGAINSAAEIKTSVGYDAAGNVVLQRDARLNETWTWYDKLGRKSAQLDGEGYLTTWARDAEGNVASETRHAGKFDGSFTVSATSSVDAIRDHLVAFAGLENRVTDFTYDKNGNRLTETRRDVALNASAVQTSAAPEAQIEYTYNKLGQVLSKEEATGDTTNYTYDDGGRLILEEGAQFTDYTGNTTARSRVAYTYDLLNNLTKMRVQAGATADDTKDRITLYFYDAAGRMTTMIVPIDIPDRSFMMGIGYDHTTTDGAFVHNYGYDALGRMVSDRYARKDSGVGTLPQEAVITRYDEAGNVKLQSFARLDAGVWNFGFDATHMNYNAYGELVERGMTGSANVTPTAYQEQFAYDAAGRLYRSVGANGASYSLYDKAGNQTLALTSSGGDLTALTAAQVTQSIQSTGDTNLTGAITNVTVYDKRNQAIQTIEPDREIVNGSNVTTAQTVTRSKYYNAFGEVMSETDGRGNTTWFKYNTMGRILWKELPEVYFTNQSGVTSATSVHPNEYYIYDISGRLTGVTDANNITTNRVLLAGTGYEGEEALVTREIRPGTGAYFDTLYDTFGDARILRNELYSGANAADSDELRYYDQQGRLIVVDHRGRGAANHVFDYYGYDGLGQRLWSYGNAYGSGQRNRTDYDTQGRIIKQVAIGGDTTDYTYSWSGTGTDTGSITGVLGRLTKTITGPAEKLTTGRYSSTEVTDYFGRMVSRTDLGGHVYTFTYDAENGQLIQRTNDQGENFSYTYHNTGQIKTTATSYTGSNTQSFSAEYRYDANGNRTYESNVANGTLAGFTGATSYRTDATVTFDALNRVSTYVGSTTSGGIALSVAYKYDLVGNVRNTLATYRALDAQGNLSATSSTQDYWYLYDEMNRITMAKASLNAGGTIGIVTSGSSVIGTGVKIEYDLAGRRKSATTVASKVVFGSPHDYERKEIYTYDGDGNLIRTDLAEGNWTSATTYTAAGSTGSKIAEYERDAMGRVTLYKEYVTPGSSTISYSKASTYNIKSQLTYDESYTLRTDGKTLTSVTTYQYSTSWDGYNNDTGKYLGGVVTHQQSFNNLSGGSNAYWSYTDNTYSWWDGATLSTTVYQPTHMSSTTNTSTYYLDDGGRTQWVDIADGRARKVLFLNDADGHVLSRDEWDNNTNTTLPEWGDPRDVHFYFNGQRIGNVTNNGTSNVDTMAGIAVHIAVPSTSKNPFRNNTDYVAGYSVADFDQSYDAINGLNYDPTATSYTAQGGETLAMVAQNLWGDASFWYMIADANGLSSGVTLTAGQVLRIPNKVHNSHNNADTFRPYDPNEAMGDTSPTTPKKPKSTCGTFGVILLVAIAVAVTILTSGAFLAATGAVQGGIGAGIGATLTASASAGSLIAAGAVGGIVGSVVSQAFGVVTGIQEKFSWKGVALAGISGAISGGLGKIAAGPQAASQVASSTASNAAGNIVNGAANAARGALATASTTATAGLSNVLKAAATGFLRGVAGSALTQGIGKVTGLQKNFDFLGVALAGVGGGVGAGVGKSFGAVSGPLERAGVGLVSGMAAGIANAAARTLITGSNFGDNLIAALPDIVGSTLGALAAESLATRASRSSRTGVGQSQSGRETGQVTDEESSRTLSARNGAGRALMAGVVPDTVASLIIPTMQSAESNHGLAGGDSATGLDLYSDNFEFDYEPGFIPAFGKFEGRPMTVDGSNLRFLAYPAFTHGDAYILDMATSWGGEIFLPGNVEFNQDLAGAVADRIISEASRIDFEGRMLMDASYTLSVMSTQSEYGPYYSTMFDKVNTAAESALAVRREREWQMVTEMGSAYLEVGSFVNAPMNIINSTRHYANGDMSTLDYILDLTLIAKFRKLGALEKPYVAPGAVIKQFSPRSDGAGCFAASTPVHTREGIKSIEEIRVGDWVLAQPEFKGPVGYRRVADTFSVGERPVMDIVYDIPGGGTETIRATSQHPFWVDDAGWKGVDELKLGDRLEMANGTRSSVREVTPAGVEAVFNFAVDGYHTYYVGSAGVWVHNASSIGDLPSRPHSGGEVRLPTQSKTPPVPGSYDFVGPVMPETVISPKMKQKILWGQRTVNSNGTVSNKIIGAHSPKISEAHPNYSVETLSINPDGTRVVRLMTGFADGNVSRIKKSTLFPANWTDSDILKATKAIGSPRNAVATRVRDRATLHIGSVNGVNMEVVKVGNRVTASYPTGVANPDVNLWLGD